MEKAKPASDWLTAAELLRSTGKVTWLCGEMLLERSDLHTRNLLVDLRAEMSRNHKQGTL